MTPPQVPDSLRELPQWLVWHYEETGNPPKKTKVPYQIPDHKGESYLASTTQSGTWTSFESAFRSFSDAGGFWDGIGFVFSPDDPYFGMDLDRCLTANGSVKPWAQPILLRFADSYAEISPSGKGIKIWARGKMPGKGVAFEIEDGRIEIYDQSRYFTVTGNHWGGQFLDIEDHQKDLEWVLSLSPHGQHKVPFKVADEQTAKIPKGRQYDSLVSFAGTLRARGAGYETIEAALLAMNREQCTEPGTDEDIRQIARNSMRWERGPSPKVNGHAADVGHPATTADGIASISKAEDDPDSHLLALCDEIIASKQSHRMYEKGLFALIAKADKHTGLEVRAKLRKEFGKDMVLTGPGSWPELYREAINVRRKKTPELEDNPPVNSLIPVQISDRQMRDISLDSIRQIKAKNDPPSLFVRSGALVHVIQDEKERPSVAVVTEARLRGILARVANFMKTDRNGEQRNAFPPVEVVKDIMAFNPQSWPFPRLISVAEVPTLRPDGTILDQPGYDEESAIFYAPASTLKSFPLPESPTKEDVSRARDVIEDAIGEFPYSDDASHANIYGLLLTPILRPAISGCTPLSVVDAPQAGTGKSLLIDVLSIITTGRPAAMMPYPYKEEEMQKQIGASLSAGRQLIVFDNLEGELRSPALALAITAKEFEARILGVSQNMTVENLSTWVVTGNNIRPAGDMPRRCYQIRLDAQTAAPYKNRLFKHPRLLNWVTNNRSEILHALLVISRYWFSCGRKEMISRTLGSFEEWHQVVGSVIAHAGISGFLDNYSNFIDQEDESPRQWEEFLFQIFEVWGGTGKSETRAFTIAELIDATYIDTTKFRSVLPAEVADCLEKKVSHRIVIGKMFRTRRQRHFGTGSIEYWLDRVPDGNEHKGSAKWVVHRALRQSPPAPIPTLSPVPSDSVDGDLLPFFAGE